MNFKDFYQKGKPAFSFEIFPPKDAAGEQSLFTALQKLRQFNPAFVSVTYGAMGSTQDKTRNLAIRIHKELGLTTAFHFTCVGSDRAFIREYVEYLKKEGIDLIVALRGDPPQGVEKFTPPLNGFRYANELVSYLKGLGGFSIAVAGYPEGHIETPDKETDLNHLVRKVEAGADIVITQLFFNNQDYFDFVERVRKKGIRVPIIPGIMPILNLKQIEKISKMCGAGIPKELQTKLLQNESSPERVKEIGIEYSLNQCQELLKNGAPGIHFYILNRAESTSAILEKL